MLQRIRSASPWSYLFILWWAGSIALSSLPASQLELVPFAWNDKAAHLGYFGLGAWLLARAWIKAGAGTGSHAVWWAVPLIIMLISACDETYQLVTPGRSGADIGDFLADAIGGLLGAAVSAMMHRNERQRPESH